MSFEYTKTITYLMSMKCQKDYSLTGIQPQKNRHSLMTLIACYCRVSTRHQKNDSQRVEINKWVTSNGLDKIAIRWFEDKDTGTTTNRPDFKKM